MAKKEMSFNDAISEIEAILKKIETGILDVDRLSESVKRAAELIKICQKKLRNAEVEIENIFKEPQKDQQVYIKTLISHELFTNNKPGPSAPWFITYPKPKSMKKPLL